MPARFKGYEFIDFRFRLMEASRALSLRESGNKTEQVPRGIHENRREIHNGIVMAANSFSCSRIHTRQGVTE